MLTPEQSRAARGWLDWSQETLAKLASVSLSTVRDFEKGRRTPIANNLSAMERVLETEGIRLLFDGDRPAGIGKIDAGGVPPSGLDQNPGAIGKAPGKRRP
jgi:transcriptional regulator with XRE-family HTH domain